ncbi:MAG: hypothetical protein ACOX6K_10465 [Sphaerochaetaceae bacterium]|jgi:chromosome segregation ATPase
MGRLQAEIAATQKEIELARQDLDVLFEELGQLVAALRQSVTIPVCAQEFQEYYRGKGELEEIQLRLAHVRAALEEIDDRSKKISVLKGTLKSLDRRYDTACSRAGAIAFEAATADTLPIHLAGMLPPVDAQQRKYVRWQKRMVRAERLSLSASGIRRAFAQGEERYCAWHLKRVNRSYETLFRQIGKAIDKSGCVMDLPGENAPHLASELSAISGERKGIVEEIELQQKQIEQVQGALDSTVLNQASRRVEELEKQSREKSAAVRLRAVAYGKALAGEVEQWIGMPAVTEQVRSCYEQITRHERRIAMLQRHIESLEIDIEVEELELLISQDAERIGHLKEQISSFQRQIVEIQDEVTENRRKIAQLRSEQVRPRLVDDVSRQDGGR